MDIKWKKPESDHEVDRYMISSSHGYVIPPVVSRGKDLAVTVRNITGDQLINVTITPIYGNIKGKSTSKIFLGGKKKCNESCSKTFPFAIYASYHIFHSI